MSAIDEVIAALQAVIDELNDAHTARTEADEAVTQEIANDAISRTRSRRRRHLKRRWRLHGPGIHGATSRGIHAEIQSLGSQEAAR